MVNKIEVFVDLLIPDTTAITAFHTLKNMGFKQLKKLKREDYYYFVTFDEFDKFSKEIGKVDIIVNANKNKYKTKLVDEKIKEKKEEEITIVHVLVQDIGDNATGTLNVLRHRLGFAEIKEMKKGVFWTLYLKADKKEALELAKQIADGLLYNKHYQECKVF